MSNLDWKVGTRKIQVIDVLELTEAMLHRNIIHGFFPPTLSRQSLSECAISEYQRATWTGK